MSQTKKQYPRLTETDIALKLGVSPTTFNRMMNQRTSPSLKTFIHLYNTVPLVKKFVKNSITEVSDESKHNYIEPDLEKLLEDENLFIAYILAFSKHRITREESW